MSERALKQLVGALVVVGVLWAISSLLSGGSGSIAPSGEIESVVEALNGADADRIEFVSTEGAVALVLGGDGWTVNGFPADAAGVGRLLEILPELRIADLVATNPANHERMGVSGEGAIAATFSAANERWDLVVGSAGRRFGTSYVRLPDADEVYLLVGALRSQATRGVDDWRDRVMARVDSSAVARIEVDHEDGAYALVRGDSAWSVVGGSDAQGTTIVGILAELSNLVASGFLADGDSIAGLEQQRSTRAYDADGGLVVEITLGGGAGDRWARSTQDEYLYRVSSFRAGRVAPARESVQPGG